MHPALALWGEGFDGFSFELFSVPGLTVEVGLQHGFSPKVPAEPQLSISGLRECAEPVVKLCEATIQIHASWSAGGLFLGEATSLLPGFGDCPSVLDGGGAGVVGLEAELVVTEGSVAAFGAVRHWFAVFEDGWPRPCAWEEVGGAQVEPGSALDLVCRSKDLSELVVTEPA